MSIAGKSLSVCAVGTVLVELFPVVSTGSLRFFYTLTKFSKIKCLWQAEGLPKWQISINYQNSK